MAQLEVGDRALGFSATTYDGNKIRLADLLGKRALVLFFYPKDGSLWAQQLADRNNGTLFFQLGLCNSKDRYT